MSDQLRRREQANFPKWCASARSCVVCTLGVSFGCRDSRSVDPLKRIDARWSLGGDAMEGSEAGFTLLALLSYQ